MFAKDALHQNTHLRTCILPVLPIHGDIALETAQKFVGEGDCILARISQIDYQFDDLLC